MDFGIPRYLLIELLQLLDRFITRKETDPAAIAIFVEMNFEDDEFADLLHALSTSDEATQIKVARATSARINEGLRLDWMEE